MGEILEQEKVVANKSSLKKRKKNKLQILLIISVAILFVVVLALGWYIFDVFGGKMEKLATTGLSKDSKQEALDLSNNDPEAGRVVEEVSKHILLPSRDFQVYSLNDASALWKENPVLYQYVQNGNKLVAYDTGIIVYDQGLDKIVDVIQFYGEREKKLHSANTSTIKQ